MVEVTVLKTMVDYMSLFASVGLELLLEVQTQVEDMTLITGHGLTGIDLKL